MIKILSRKNPTIKTYGSLNRKKKREETNLFRFEGEILLEEALKFKQPIEAVVVADNWCKKNCFDLSENYKLLKEKNIPVYCLRERDYQSISGLTSPEGIMVIGRHQEQKDRDHDFLIVLEDVQDPGNVGTIIRTADAAGLSQVIYTDKTSDPYNEKVVRASMGSVFHLNLTKIDNLEGFLKSKKGNALIIGASLRGETHNFEEKLSSLKNKPWIILVGNERKGLSLTAERLSDYLYKISMYGLAESLNVSVATGIILFELAKIKNSDEGKV